MKKNLFMVKQVCNLLESARNSLFPNFYLFITLSVGF